MFTCASECYFKKLIFDGSTLSGYGNSAGEDAIKLTGSGVYHEIKDCTFDQFNKTINIINNVELWLFENDISNAVSAGVEIAAGTASGAFVKLSENDFLSCGKGVNLLSGTNARISIINCGFYNGSSSTGINYVPATFTSFETIFLTGNTWNRAGTFINGFDFSRADARDKNAEIINNVGIPNQNPFCKINLLANTQTVSVGTTWVKANWASGTQTGISSKFTMATNSITYQPANNRDLVMWVSGNVIYSSGTARVVSIAIVKNGVSTTRYGEATVRLTTSGEPFQWSTTVYLPNVLPGDYFEVWCKVDNATNLTFQDLNWFTNSQ
jgi:hypothetical protein